MGWLEAILEPYVISLGFSSLSALLLFALVLITIFKD